MNRLENIAIFLACAFMVGLELLMSELSESRTIIRIGIIVAGFGLALAIRSIIGDAEARMKPAEREEAERRIQDRIDY